MQGFGTIKEANHVSAPLFLIIPPELLQSISKNVSTPWFVASREYLALLVQVRLENETVWVSQAAMAQLFDTTKQNISLHLKSIFKEGELVQNQVVKGYFTAAVDGKSYRTKDPDIKSFKSGNFKSIAFKDIIPFICTPSQMDSSIMRFYEKIECFIL